MKKNNGILSFLKEHAEEKPVSFHMPGHKGARFFKSNGYGWFLHNIADYDITEINGADNLFQAEGIIRKTSEKYKKLYECKQSYLLVNGTSGGILASVLASVSEGKRLIMARNCHKSVFNSLKLGGIQPAYAYPEILPEYGISGEVSPEEIERLLQKYPDAEAVILPSPNYYGICSDIRSIANIVHDHGKILIVDQAHGAHLKFFEGYQPKFGKLWAIPESAETCGADFVINSTHKTLATFTQSAVLNVCTDRAMELKNNLEDKLQSVESSSPSYLLMGSLDVNAEILENSRKKLFKGWRSNVKWFYNKAVEIRGLRLMNTENLDTTKLNLDMSAYGLTGAMLSKMLEKYGIYSELVTGNLVMCMSGIGNSRDDYKRLLMALKDIAAGCIQKEEGKNPESKPETEQESPWLIRRVLHETTREKELVPLNDCPGRICAESVIPYPPGIPLTCPGEEIAFEDVIYISQLRMQGEKVIGITEDECIWVQKQG